MSADFEKFASFVDDFGRSALPAWKVLLFQGLIRVTTAGMEGLAAAWGTRVQNAEASGKTLRPLRGESFMGQLFPRGQHGGTMAPWQASARPSLLCLPVLRWSSDTG
jgi:hypothetical protein